MVLERAQSNFLAHTRDFLCSRRVRQTRDHETSSLSPVNDESPSQQKHVATTSHLFALKSIPEKSVNGTTFDQQEWECDFFPRARQIGNEQKNWMVTFLDWLLSFE
jgi:hypothetical protein